MNYMQKKHLCISIFVYASACFANNNFLPSAITYRLNGGRFGDNLYSCLQAFWIHYTFGSRFLFIPFQHSEDLVVHHMYEHYTPEIRAEYNDHQFVDRHKKISFDPAVSCLYTSIFEYNIGIDWTDTNFIEKAREIIKPYKNDWEYLVLPTDKHTIAVHVRTGGGFCVDTPSCRRNRPLHFPGIKYHINALKIILSMLEGPCYVHIFSDQQDINTLIQKITGDLTETELSKVTFAYRTEDNSHDRHVVQDFFDMTRFSYLIRSQSHFTTFVERLGYCKMSVVPTKAQKTRNWGEIKCAEIRRFEGIDRTYRSSEIVF